MKLDKEDKESQPDPTRDLIMGQIGDENHDDDDLEDANDLEDGDFEDDEEQSEADYIRSRVLAVVAYLYRDLKDANLSDDEYSKRRKFVDDLSTPFIRVAVLPDDEVKEQFSKSYATIPQLICDLLLSTIYNNGDSTVIDKENRKITIVLDWRFYYLDSFRCRLCYTISPA